MRLYPALEVGPVAISLLEGNGVLGICELKTISLADALARLGIIPRVCAHELASAAAIPVEMEALGKFVRHDALRDTGAR